MDLLNSLLPIIGIIIGASIQAYFSRRSEQKKQTLTNKTLAYVDYIQSVVDSVFTESKKRDEVLARAVNAKARICIYGSEEVIKALGRFESLGANISTKEQASIFSELVKCMRMEHLSEDSINIIDELDLLLFGNQSWK